MDMHYDLNSGARIYNKFFLRVYDVYVLSFAGKLIWKCPKSTILSLYNQYVSDQHLEVGVGTGYFLDKCQFPSPQPKISLVDLNPNCLISASYRIRRYQPSIHQADICEKLQLSDEDRFDSVGMNYLLHCLPGDMEAKAKAFINLKPYLNPGAIVFGATVLNQDSASSSFVKKYLKFCNNQGVFSNNLDDKPSLESMLQKHFSEVTVEQVGCAAVFIAKN